MKQPLFSLKKWEIFSFTKLAVRILIGILAVKQELVHCFDHNTKVQ